MKDRKKPDKFLPPHGMPSDGCEFAFSSRVPPKALTIKIPYTSWNYQIMGNGRRKRQSNLSRRSKGTVMVKPLCFSVMDGNRIPMSWKAPTVMKNRSRTQDGDVRRIRSGLWMPTSNMRQSLNTNGAVASLTLKSASYGERKRRSWTLSVRSTEGKQFIPVM